MTNTTSSPARKQPSALDRAIYLSVAAMVAMNVFVLAQQLHSAPAFAATETAAAQQA